MPTRRSINKKIPRASDQLESFRVRFWYEGVQIGLGYTQAKQVERYFGLKEDPNFMEKDPPGKWNRYKLGKTTPQPRLVSTVDKEIEGSAREINHPLWKVLGLNGKGLNLDEYFNELDSEVKAIVFSPKIQRPAEQMLNEKFSLIFYRKLVRVGNLDSLTALVLYWHKAQLKNNIGHTRYLARFIFDVLLMIGNEFWLRGLIKEIFEIFKINVFEKTDWGNATFVMSHKQYWNKVCFLSRLSSHVSKHGYINSLEEEHQLKGQLLTKTLNLKVHQALHIELQYNNQETLSYK